MALHVKPRTLLVRAALVAACGCLLSVPRVASEYREVHTNAWYDKSVHGKPVIEYVDVNFFVHNIADGKLFLDKGLSKETGTLGRFPVPKCLEKFNPCPFGPNGKRREMRSRKTKQTVFIHLIDTKTNKTEVKQYIHKVDSECYCLK
ncbi:uncharacterized protein LOC125045135 [Penaeus chinensis]|uniref:uncharacterized protein LOC125045135 n=1 Tax=Penaeus chinensis TaxID=139456 RepID=UPI001FB591F3|nr:uncharacterized protein LOC125045135 [Penaeus chinensis]